MKRRLVWLIVAVVLACFCGVGFLVGIPAVILAMKARKEIKLSGNTLGGSSQALAGLITGWVAIGLGAATLIYIIIVIFAGQFNSQFNYY